MCPGAPNISLKFVIFGVQIVGVTENGPRFLPAAILKRITYDILTTTFQRVPGPTSAAGVSDRVINYYYATLQKLLLFELVVRIGEISKQKK